MLKKTTTGFLFSCLIILFAGCQFSNTSIIRPEIRDFPPLSSQFKIERTELYEWDNIAAALLRNKGIKRFGDAHRLFAYLYSAQKAFADASFQISADYSGTLDPISLHVIKLFYPEYTREIKTDPYSRKLTELLVQQIDERFRREEEYIHPIKIEKKEGRWWNENPRGASLSSMQPWALEEADEFRSPPPPPSNHDFWKGQTKKVQAEVDGVTDWKRSRSLFWQGIGEANAGDWRVIALNYMKENKIPLQLELEVREKIVFAMLDALIAVYESKYIFLVQRPISIDPTIETIFPTPNHPSYPSAHSVVSTAVTTVLEYYFPENRSEWIRLANEGSQSRIWAGIHFPIDLEAGKKQGVLVGKAVIFR